MNETTGKPYAILRIASDRRYRDQEGNRLTDFISIKVRGPLAEFCAAYAWKGCKLAASGDFETTTTTTQHPTTPDNTSGKRPDASSFFFMEPPNISHLDGKRKAWYYTSSTQMSVPQEHTIVSYFALL